MTITGGSGKLKCILISKKSKCMGRGGPCGAGAICSFEGSGIGAQGADIRCLSTRESFPVVATTHSSSYVECSFQVKDSFCCRVTTKWENDAHNMSSKFNVSSMTYFAKPLGLCNIQSMFVHAAVCLCFAVHSVVHYADP